MNPQPSYSGPTNPSNNNFQANQQYPPIPRFLPGQQMINSNSQIPYLKRNPLLANPTVIQDLEENKTISSDESSVSFYYDPSSNEQMNEQNMQLNPIKAPLPYSAPHPQSQGIPQVPIQNQLSSKGIPLKDPSIPQQSQKNIQVPPPNLQVINPNTQANSYHNEIPIRPPQPDILRFFPNNPISNPNVSNISQQYQPITHYPAPLNPQSKINQPNPSYQNPSNPLNPQYQNYENFKSPQLNLDRPQAQNPQINQPFAIPQKRPSSNIIDEDGPNPLLSSSSLHTTILECPDTIAKRVNSAHTINEIKQRYNLASIECKDTGFWLKGEPNSVTQAAEELKGVIAQESSLSYAAWEWLRDDGKFEAYRHTTSEIIENAYNQGRKDVRINIDNIWYNVIFGNPHIQMLPNSNISRTIRRNNEAKENVDRKIDENEIIWYWQDDDRVFKKYTAEASRQIEATYNQFKTGALVQGSNIKGYLIDFKKMKQINEKTRYKRSIRRGESDSS